MLELLLRTWWSEYLRFQRRRVVCLGKKLLNASSYSFRWGLGGLGNEDFDVKDIRDLVNDRTVSSCYSF